jgi:GNAT superfamily N-acetyltransferase
MVSSVPKGQIHSTRQTYTPVDRSRTGPLAILNTHVPTTSSANFHVRQAVPDDIPVLRTLIEQSVRGLQARDYTPAQIEQALASVYGVDTQLIDDGTYFVVETGVDPGATTIAAEGRVRPIVGCGGWSKRRTLFGGDHFAGREDGSLDPVHDAAKIRAFFVHPDWARQGIGSLVLDTCEHAAFEAGFARLEMGATLTGVPFYRDRGYTESDQLTVPLAKGESLSIVRMYKLAPPS